jgi:hypothetical protein
MNTLEQNETLQHLPYELLKNPERRAIQAFIKNRFRSFGRLKIAMIAAFIVYLTLLYIFETVHTTITELAIFDNIFNLFPLVIFLGLAIVFHNRKKRFAIPDDGIDKVIEKLKLQQVPA